MIVTKDNFYLSTKGVFKGCKIPKRYPDYVSFSSLYQSYSLYWYTKNGVIRASDHWVFVRTLNDGTKDMKYNKGCDSIASCDWGLKTNNTTFQQFIRKDRCLYANKLLAGYLDFDKFSSNSKNNY